MERRGLAVAALGGFGDRLRDNGGGVGCQGLQDRAQSRPHSRGSERKLESQRREKGKAESRE